MIVVASISILAAVALPTDQDSTKRAKLSDVILAASACRTSITEVYQTLSAVSQPGGGNWGCKSSTPSSKYVAKVDTGGAGAIRVTATDIDTGSIDENFVTLIPADSTEAAVPSTTNPLNRWICGNSAAITGSTFVTTVPSEFLQGSCHGV